MRNGLLLLCLLTAPALYAQCASGTTATSLYATPGQIGYLVGGDTEQLVFTANCSDGSAVTVSPAIQLSSSSSTQTTPPTTFSVNSSDFVISQAGVAIGDAWINASYGGQTAQVHVYGVYQKSIYFDDLNGVTNPSTAMITGGKAQFFAHALYSDGQTGEVFPTYSLSGGTGLTLTNTADQVGVLTSTGTTATTATVTASYAGPETTSAQTATMAVTVAVPPLNTYYVRQNGGTPAQCNGRTDADYTSSASPNCAWGDPRYAWSNGGSDVYVWKLVGGDTLLIHAGTNPWLMTLTGPNVFDNGGGGNYATSYDPPPPSGSAAHPTRILGENYASGAAGAKVQLYGGSTLYGLLNLKDTSFVEVESFDLTDHSQCTKFPAALPVACSTNSVDTWVYAGVLTNKASTDITQQDLNIHGFLVDGAEGAFGGNFLLTRVRWAGNGGSGWDTDDGTASIGSYTNVNGTVLANGCVEEYPIAHTYPFAYCYDDMSGGYGDGFGLTYDSDVQITWLNPTVMFNTQDGLDELYANSHNSSITITGGTFYGNMGDQVKVGAVGQATLRNNLILADCNRMSVPISGFPSTFNAELTDFCRAHGPGLVLDRLGDNATGGHGSYIVQFNTMVGYGADGINEIGINGFGCTDINQKYPSNDCNTADVDYRNNLEIGYAFYGTSNQYDGDKPAPTGVGGAIFTANASNIFFDFGDQPAGTNGTNVFTDPQIVGEVEPGSTTTIPAEPFLDNVTGLLTAASTNAVGKGVPISGVTTDFNGNPRSATAPSIGAFEYATSTTANPVITGTPLVNISGTTNSLSCTVSGAACVSPSWSSSVPAVATINASGTILPKAPGVTNITVSVVVGGTTYTSAAYPMTVINQLVLIHGRIVTR